MFPSYISVTVHLCTFGDCSLQNGNLVIASTLLFFSPPCQSKFAEVLRNKARSRTCYLPLFNSLTVLLMFVCTTFGLLAIWGQFDGFF